MDNFDSITKVMKTEPRSPSMESAADAMLRLSGSAILSCDPTSSCSSSMGIRAIEMSPISSMSSPSGAMTLKDEQYWVKRRKNNVAARRSREKRRINDAEMTIRIRQLIQQNQKLEEELVAVKRHFCLPLDTIFTNDNAPMKPKKQEKKPVPSEPKCTTTTSEKEVLERFNSQMQLPEFVPRPSVFPGPSPVVANAPQVVQSIVNHQSFPDDDDMEDDDIHSATSTALQTMLKNKQNVDNGSPVKQEPLDPIQLKLSYNDHDEVANQNHLHDNDDNENSMDSHSPLGTALFDDKGEECDGVRYVERRRRNNIAARKCRENRKKQNTIRMVKSNILEDENDKLKVELKSLSSEYTTLYRLMETKKRAIISGQQFNIPDETVSGQVTPSKEDVLPQ